MNEIAVALAERLEVGELAIPAGFFTRDKPAAKHPGLYSWWVDDEGRALLEGVLEEGLESLIYAGQAGAASRRAAKPSSATLGSRIITNHLNGTAYGSTFRKSISAILLGPLGLTVERPDHLTKVDNLRVSEWMRQHLSLVAVPYDDRETLHEIEGEVLRLLNPPLNLEGMSRTPVRDRLTALRRELTRPAVRVGQPEVVGEASADTRRALYFVPTSGPADWQHLLAEPELHWAVGRSARTMAHAWESADGWPSEVGSALREVDALARYRPIYGFPEHKTPLPGGSRASQTDLLVVASDGETLATVAVEGKVDEPFGPTVESWAGSSPSPGKEKRLQFLSDLLGLDHSQLANVRYQLLHRTAAAKIEGERNGSRHCVMLVHSWSPDRVGFNDFREFARRLDVEAAPGRVVYSQKASVWLGWIEGDPRYLSY